MPRSFNASPLGKTSPNSAHLSGNPGLDIFRETYTRFKTICQAFCGPFIFELPAEVDVGGFQVELPVKAGIEMFQEWF